MTILVGNERLEISLNSAKRLLYIDQLQETAGELFYLSVGHESGIEIAKKKADEVCADMCCDKVKLDSQINALYV